MRTKKVLIVENHTIVRQGIRALLSYTDDLEVIAEAVDGRDALRLAQETRPDVILMDIRMPNLNGVDACRQILKELPSAHIIALTLLTDRKSVQNMFDAGAKGYLLKDSGLDQLLHAIRTVLEGKQYLAVELGGPDVTDYRDPDVPEGKYGKSLLSSREREVLQLVAEGRTTRQIADELGISVKTVETHRHNLMQKTHLRSIADLTKYAIRNGITSVDLGEELNDDRNPVPLT
ncbi:MAG: response regulator transcription factor [Phycisphaerae bacterium]|nr:response regulator transcription factor [Phycisphaerae bacterium]